ncbi:permease, partial [bacterium]|nr:permease [bacterium]
SPMINEVALTLLFGLFGWKIALIYIISGLLIAVFSGLIIDRLKVEKLIVNFNKNHTAKDIKSTDRKNVRDRIYYSINYSLGIIKKIWPYVIIGIGFGAWIHGYIPSTYLSRYAGANQWYAVPLATLIGIPLYANAGGVIPLVSALTEKGLAIGTTLAFMMAVTALSLPEFMILTRIMKTRLIVIFVLIVGLGIIFTGYLFNFIL